MKIVFNTDQVYLHGGIERVMAIKANYFANLPDFEVIVLTTEQQNIPPFYYLDSRIKLVDLQIDYNRSKSYLSFENLSKAIKHFFKQKKMLHTIQPDFIISANYNFDHFWLPFSKPKNAKVIKEVHSSGYLTPAMRKKTNFASKLKWGFNDFILAQYDKIIVLNEDEKKYQKAKNVVVIPNSISITDRRAELLNKKVLAAGRITPIKGFDQLIKAWKVVNQKHPHWELHIYGDNYSKTKEELITLIGAADLSNAIHVKDSVDDLSAIMLDYSIYAMSSHTECFPMVLLEALSAGLPIVSYDCPHGPRNIISNGIDGLLTPNQNPEELANGIITLIENEPLRAEMGKNAKNNSNKFATGVIMKQWLHLFHDLNKNIE